jgi:hypothetical protein
MAHRRPTPNHRKAPIRGARTKGIPTRNRPIDHKATIALRITVEQTAVVKAVAVGAVVVKVVVVRAVVDLVTA